MIDWFAEFVMRPMDFWGLLFVIWIFINVIECTMLACSPFFLALDSSHYDYWSSIISNIRIGHKRKRGISLLIFFFPAIMFGLFIVFPIYVILFGSIYVLIKVKEWFVDKD